MNTFKRWILNFNFVRREINMASINGTDYGKKQANDYWEDALDERVEQRMSSLLGAVDERLAITYDKKTGLIFVGGQRLDEASILSLKAEAEYFQKSEMWKIINESLKNQAQKTIFENSTNFQDVLNGKMMLYDLSFQNKILDIFASYTQKASLTK